MASEFSTWFVKQHGKRLSKKPLEKLLEDARAKENIAKEAAALYRKCELYDEKETSALYAWQAKPDKIGLKDK